MCVLPKFFYNAKQNVSLDILLSTQEYIVWITSAYFHPAIAKFFLYNHLGNSWSLLPIFWDIRILYKKMTKNHCIVKV